MCKSLCDNLPMKLLLVITIGVLCIDLEVLRKTYAEQIQLKHLLDNETY